MNLYKFTTSLEIAKRISLGIFRFYELTKYIKIEDNAGRLDTNECALSFAESEYLSSPEELPTASFNGINFKCISIRPDEKYISQYFVFCVSTAASTDALGDCTHVVELSQDIFETLELLLRLIPKSSQDSEGLKFFSHGPVEYYDIKHHPAPLLKERWREVYLKHSNFRHQNEYRAALFASDHLFARVHDEPLVIARPIYHPNGARMNFDLKLSMQSGIDSEGWRYIEIDISEFAAKLTQEPCKVTEIARNPSDASPSERDG